MPYRVNGQYIMEGLASSFLFTIGGLGFVILDQVSVVNDKPVCRFSSVSGKNTEIRKEYLRTSY